ncbi:multicopper oxidase domain-containing protein [Tessaracoccus caeni]|uniref:multicopper oxidase domain-containing protein n=1 Tax=Tessaracoccus caeni TaxID=3031239 RepID=UPI0023DA332B|nr:multicopper oxidase domain-containing protein [Tessaracoccus caeni]MDF1489819.1 multicopper oxidase domain-containing protein [Tessaracoccus caeni]
MMRATRRRNPMRDYPVVVWLLGAAVVAVCHRWVPEATWLMVHLILLGALTHAVMVWSRHFSQALLKVRLDEAAESRHTLRLWLVSVGALLVFIGVPTTWWWVTLVGAVVVTVAVVWHGAELWSALRKALPGRFRVSIRYYIVAALSLPIGVGFGVALAWGLSDEWHARLLVAHSMTNLLGWFGLTVAGTLVTFWPTVLRTKMDPRADKLAQDALPILLIGLAILVTGSLLGMRPLAVGGLAFYFIGLLWWARALIGPARTKPPRSYAGGAIGAAVVWFAVAIVWLGSLLLTTDDLQLATSYPLLAGVFAAGFGAQILTGALSYLIPSVLGGGPSVVRIGNSWFDKGAGFRLVVINGGIVVFLLATPSWVKVVVSVLVLGAMVSFIPLMFQAIRHTIAERRRLADGGETRPFEEPRSIWTAGQVLAAVAALSVAVAAGVGIDPAAAGVGQPQQSQAAIEPTGEVVRVEVKALDMAFEPSVIEVNPGDRLIIDLVNEDPTNFHDLMVAGVRSPRLGVGERVELDLGVISESTEGWCTVTGHRQMGMTLQIVVGDAPAPSGDGGHQGHETRPRVMADPDARIDGVVDPVLAPLTDETVHELTMTVTEVPLEVAPGVWQKRWTFNGSSVGPTLHGRVGDVFVITLVNDGTMGHSIDFHAGALAPDEPMRTIAPGESLTYRFTAERAGVWMYHCSTAPMSAHIAAGMHGAVIIEPEGLPEVDHSYVLVQSEVYLDGAAGSADEAAEVNVDAVSAEKPDFVVFNGVANQYDQRPFEVKTGERARFWVLDAGPNRASSFHIVGGQFDTMYLEGSYLLKDGRDAFGTENGGAQAMGLEAAQGGFVELTFPEAGHYSVVSHSMVDAERGAHGIVRVTD